MSPPVIASYAVRKRKGGIRGGRQGAGDTEVSMGRDFLKWSI